MGQRATTVCIADDHAVIRHGIASVLGSDANFKVLAEGGSAEDAIEMALKYAPDIMMLDLTMPGGGMDALRTITAQAPSVRCIVFTASEDASVAMAAIKAGARGYLLKGVSGENLLTALRVVLRDESYVSPEFATKLVEAAMQVKTEEATTKGLSYRESQIIREVEKGLTNRQVAEKLHLSEKTVKHYMTSLMQKFGVNNRVSAINEHRRQTGKHAAH